ncbi:MAG: hypothetical protein A2Y07_07890 [Planctomycetes bacterium GWF2_50_10]|nr:MAG: hypothetical protein A2Y07_07890 [Planctomycetes bacterium GWF2_50_10]
MDLSTRTSKKEFLDSPDMDNATLTEAYRFMAVVNRFFGGHGVVKKFVLTQCRRLQKQHLQILDLGSGGCDIPIAVRKWGLKKKIDLNFTCLEISDFACDLGLKNIKRSGLTGIEIIKADIFSYTPASKFDAAMGSMFFHHFTNDQIIQIAKIIRGFGCKSLLINDLARTRLNYFACKLAAVALDPLVRHDALTSIERGFTKAGLNSMLQNFTDAQVTVKNQWFCRIMGTVEWDT